ncbi:hypothetical protein LTR85_006174 [Meristemomyces frigidus]|nr:hypothetical protein LTR85_006174 [Meristemomyces frigidus]
MGSSSNPKHSNGLIAVLLLTRSKPGPKLVFHYPVNPQPAASSTRGGASDISDSDQESDDEPEVDGATRDSLREVASVNSSAVVHPDETSPRNADIHSDSDHVLGYRVDTLEKLLSPGRWSDRKKFEICLDGITFVGHPVYANEDGSWSTKDRDSPHSRNAEDEREATPTLESQRTSVEDLEAATTGTANVTITAPETSDQAAHDSTHVPESLDSHQGLSFATSMTSTSTASGAVTEQMTMFHIVFAVKPENQDETLTIYHHVTKKLAKALHYCQKQSNYVAAESRKLLALRAKAKQTKMDADASWKQMVEGSELAWALSEVYERISAGEIAGVRLNGMALSMQVPHTRPGSSDEDSTLGPHSGLLLLEDKEVLIHQLAHPDASPLVRFLREHTPTKSLQKHSPSLDMPLGDVQYLARHLIKWRKGQIIAPLHPRNMYTSDTGAPINKIRELMPVYGRKFAALPSLPQMLKVLSGKPIQYGLLIPSRDHRAPYMDILAFLVRHRFVVQLKTYGWLKAERTPDNHAAPSSKAKTKRPVSGVSLLSPQRDDDNMSVSSGRTAIPISDVPANHQTSDHPVRHRDIIHGLFCPADDVSAALAHVKEAIADPELRERFEQLLPYFDGKHAFEDIAAEEGVKRARVEEWIGMLLRQGNLLTFRSV